MLILNIYKASWKKKTYQVLKQLKKKFEENLNIYLKLFVLLYADDTVIMAESHEDLQAQLNVFGEYCKK